MISSVLICQVREQLCSTSKLADLQAHIAGVAELSEIGKVALLC
jgi:hypothetical protein